jgi:uncharacterized protein involved in response to NO
MLNISDPNQKRGSVLLQLGFRPFFLGAAVFAILAMAVWMGIFVFGWQLPLLGITSTLWHAHEMLFGYALAVIAGFLLTAVKNWTGQQTIQGSKLLVLFVLWAVARLIPIANIGSIEFLAGIDCLFLISLALAVAVPVIKVKQWGQLGILAILFLILIANLVFYAGLMGTIENGEIIGIYSCLYLILALVFVMAQRVMPMFIQNGVVEQVKLTNRKWLDISSMVLFPALWVFDILIMQTTLTGILAASLFFLHSLRLYDWYTKGLWKSPMVWILYLAYVFLVLGFALKAASIVTNISPFLSVHAFMFGGVGVLTMGMMARVSLGHTGRNVLQPPAALPVAFGVLLLSAVVRVIFPLIVPSEYSLWIALSQVGWILSFSLFLILFFPILSSPRIDGQPG